VIGANAFVPAVPKLREAALRIRRIGLGIMGLADVAYAMRVRYGSEPCLDLFSQIMEFVRFHAMLSSSRLAGERGSFPELKNSIYGGSEWKTPTPLSAHKRDFGRPDIDWNVVRTEIREHGLRNGALLTIAPTGTIGTVAGCEGYGCEPVFALAYTRKVKEKSGDVVLTYFSPAFVAALEEARASGEQRKRILDEVLKTGSCQGIEVLPGWIRDTFVVSGDIPASDHILVQATLQRFVDNSISKTINFPATATVSDVRGAYLKAWEIGCKGLAIYVTGSRSDVILETKAVQESKQAAPSSASISPEEDATPRPEIKFAKKRPRPDFLRGATYRADTPLGDAFITVNGTEDGEPFEVFMNVGRGGSDVAAVSEAMGRLISLVLRIPSEVSPTLRLEEIVSQLEGIGGRKQRGFGAKRVTSLPDSVAKCLGDHAKRFCRGTAEVVPTCAEVAPGDHMKIGDLCPDCNNCTLIKVGGCHKCYVCGRNECQ
jgi:ribonucleoside-diphosphate reductase alpha chain